MEKRTVLAFALSMVVLLAFQAWQASVTPPPKKLEPPPAVDGAPSGGAPTSPIGESGTALGLAPTGRVEGEAATPTAAGEAAPSRLPAAPVLTRAIENDQVEATFSTQGAALVSWRLKGYRAESSTEPLDLLRPGGVVAPALTLSIYKRSGERMAPAADDAVWSLEEGGPEGTLTFARPPLADGTVIRKTVRLERNAGFGLDVTLDFENRGTAPRQVDYAILAVSAGITPEDEGREFVPAGEGRSGPLFGVAGVADGANVKLKTELATSIPAHGAPTPLEFAGNTTYGGVASKYFAAVLLPAREGQPAPTLFLESGTRPLGPSRQPLHYVTAGYRIAPPTSRFVLPAGARAQHRYLFFAGPKVDDVLVPYASSHLERLIDYTSVIPGAEVLSTFFLAILRRLHDFTGNWGIAIVILTLLVRSAVHPLSRASIKNMAKMQNLAPKIKEIQKKYEGRKSKESQQKQTLEVMELYKTHNASPVLGCLPTLVQLPVFIGLYNALAYSIELRQTDFLYMHDLSKPDRLFSFGGANVWFFGGYFNLLPLLMVATMIIQQRMQPPPPDPQAQQQAKMMQWMMVFFGALFYHVPAGLVVYFLTSSLLGMIETKWVKSQIKRDEEATALAGRPAPAR